MSVSSKSSGITSNRWFKPVVVTAIALVVALVLVLIAQWLRTLQPVQQFLVDYPGHSAIPEGTPTGFPAWLGWQHFLNMFFLVLIIRSGWQVRTTTRPPAYWTRNNKGFIKTKNAPGKISLDLWFHLTLDALWILNGLVFVILLFATGQWMRVVPTSWDIIPNAVSAGLQYLSLDWPLENGWVTNRQIEAARIAMTRKIRRGGKVWINLFPDKPFTKKPAETRMGSGKGSPEGWVAVVKPGRVMFELAGVDEPLAKEALRLAGQKLPIKTKFVRREADLFES